MTHFYFRCRSNPNAPLFVTTELWEAQDMAKHPEYERVDAKGNPLQTAEDAFINAPRAQLSDLL